mmetsp:Transcript_15750/g.47641  ORF Transcript_15750/g.47641 Transcript_15750/m.47641 type:complete len:80 (-) Transcript_15750:82-321(-)
MLLSRRPSAESSPVLAVVTSLTLLTQPQTSPPPIPATPTLPELTGNDNFPKEPPPNSSQNKLASNRTKSSLLSSDSQQV